MTRRTSCSLTARGIKMPAGDTIARTKHYELRRSCPRRVWSRPRRCSACCRRGIGPAPDGVLEHGQPGHIWALLWAKSGMPLEDQILAYAGSGTAGGPPQGRTIRSWRQDSPGDQADIVAEVDDKGPTTFWVHESWHPRWHAYLDGTEVPVRRVTPDFMAVDAGAGTHTIELRFERPLWAWLVWLLWPAPAVIAWLAMRRSKRGLPAASGPA